MDSYEGEGSPAENKLFFESLIKEYKLEEIIIPVTADACGESIPVDQDSVDIVYLSNTLHHIYLSYKDIRRDKSRPEHVVRFMRNIHSVCKSEGMVILQEALRHNITELLPASFNKANINWKTKQNPGAWINLFEEYNFDLESVTYYVPYKLRFFKSLLSRRFFSYFLKLRYRIVMHKKS